MLIAFVKFLAWSLAAIPQGMALAWGRGVGWLLYVLLKSKRRLVTKTLAGVFPDWPASRIRSVCRSIFQNQGLLVAESFRRYGKPRRDPLDDVVCNESDLAMFDDVMARGKGALVLTAHINNYELLSAWAARRYPMTVVVKDIKPRELNNYLNDRRREAGMQVLGHHGTYRKVLRSVTSGGCVGFILDQNMIHREGVFVTFLGRPACTTAGLAMLSAQTGAPVLPVFLMREGRGYRVRTFPSIPPPVNRDVETLQDATQLYTNVIDQVVRETPEAWIWMHKRWKTPPQPGDRITLPDGSVRHA